MLIANLLKVFNCVARTFPPLRNNYPIRQLSAGTARVIEEVNLNKEIALLGEKVEFYKITRISKEMSREFDPKNIGIIPDAYSWGKYSFPVMQKKAFKRVKKVVPLISALQRKWNNRPQTEIEATIGRMMSGFMPYIDLTAITFFPYLMQTGYFVFFRPVVVFSGLGSAPTIKMLTDRTRDFDSESHGRLYVLVKITREEALNNTPLSELAVKFVTPQTKVNDEDSD